MAHPLAELREHLLYLPDIADKLKVADSYLVLHARMGSGFILPAQHAVVKPILDYYAGDLTGWVKYVKGIRDRIGRSDERWADLQELYRMLEIRNTQRIRRERLNSALAVALSRKLIADNKSAKAAYERRCTLEWMRLRTLTLDAARKGSPSKRLTEDERSKLLDEFWEGVDQQLAAGEIPKP